MPLPSNLPKFGAAKPPPSPAAQAAPSPQPAAKPTTPASTGRGFSLKRDAPADYASAGNVGVPDAPEDMLVSGTYAAYVSKLGTSKKGSLYLNFKIHAPGEDVHGAEVYFGLAVDTSKSAQAQRMMRKKIVEFFTNSGFPETRWPAASNGAGKVPPIVDLFTIRADFEGGGFVRVPLLLEAEFFLEEDKNDNQKFYQRVKVAKPIEPLVAAPVMRFVEPWVADMCGWPYSLSEYGSADVDRQRLAEDYAGAGLFQPDGDFEQL